MYDYTKYELTSYLCLFLRYFANIGFGFSFLSKLLVPKCGKRKCFLLFAAMYLPFQIDCYFAFNNTNHLEDTACILLNIGFLLLIQRLLFKGDFGRELFAAMTIVAGRDLLSLMIAVLDFKMLGDLNDLLLNYLMNNRLEMFLQWGNIISFGSFVLMSAIAAAAYALMLRLYLKLISKGLSEKSRSVTASETAFLVLMPAASLCIRIILQIMNADEPMGYYSSVYYRYPATKLLIPLAAFLLLTAIIASAMLFGRLMRYNDEKLKRRLLEAQITGMEKEIAEIKDIYSDIRGLRHDMHNHIENISLYVKTRSGEQDKTLTDYLGQMQKTVDRLDFSFNTGNPITDIIIRRRVQEAEKKSISFKFDFVFPNNLGIDAFDIGVILDNALENCIAACEKSEGERDIYLGSYIKGSLMFIETENSFSGEIIINPETGLPVSGRESSEGHGLGLSNIKRCAEKYKGDIDIGITGNKFTLTVMLHGTRK